MTREEAIKYAESKKMRLEALVYNDDCKYGNYAMYSGELSFVNAALTALRPVSREQVEKVFPGCPACKNGLPKLHIPAFRAMAVCNQHMDHEAFDIELNSKFCLNCGRPLTDEAVQMVMDRLSKLEEMANEH